MHNHVLSFDGILWGVGVWVKCVKSQKSEELRGTAPNFRVWLLFVVVVRKGWALFEELES